MLVCSRSISEITNSIIKSFSIDMSAQTNKAKKKGNPLYFFLHDTCMIK